MAILHMSLSEFNDYTPAEIDYALKAHSEIITSQNNLSWEQVRLQIYYSYLLTPGKKRKVTYKTFKREYLPFDFDQDKKEDDYVLTNEDIDVMQNFFKKPKGA